MKQRALLFIFSVMLSLSTISGAVSYALADTNLIANESVETSSTTALPTSWKKDKWGTSTTTLQHKAEGRTGGKSLYISMASRQSGDAKWMPDAVSAQPNTEYTYSEWYKSSIATEIDLQYIATDGKVSYVFVKTLPKSAAWANVTVKFTTPANVAKVTPVHLIAKNGWVQTDDFSLKSTAATPTPDPTPTPPPTPQPENPPVVDQDNLITNESFEQQVSVGQPTNWNKNSWGTNTAAFDASVTGRTGTKSGSLTISSYTDGDAKWFANPVSVTAGKSYVYRDYYKSSVISRSVVAMSDAAGNTQYVDLPQAAASPSSWTLYSANFTVPANIVKASVYHLLDRVGTLAIDDVSLNVALPTQTGTQTTVPNASVETSNDGGVTPASWTSGKWGTSTAAFDYLNEGHDSSKSVKVTLNNYVDGDAKWLFNPVTNLQAGKQYRFTNWYKSSVAPHPVAMFTMADGSVVYQGMPQPTTPISTTTWQKYSETFSVPTNTASVSVFMYIAQNGWLQTDDYSINDYAPNGFNRALLTLTFDDGHEDNATNALPLLNQYGFKSTQCFATSFIEGQSQTVINGVLAFKNSGHEICSHTVSHPFLTTVPTTTLNYELQHSKQYLQQLTGQTINNFATPYGDYNGGVVNEIKKYYRSHRSVDEGYNTKDNFNIYNVRVQNILDTTTASQVKSWVEQAQADKTWLVLVYHRIASNAGPYDSYTNVFAEQLAAINATGVTVSTYQSALDEVTPQL